MNKAFALVIPDGQLHHIIQWYIDIKDNDTKKLRCRSSVNDL